MAVIYAFGPLEQPMGDTEREDVVIDQTPEEKARTAFKMVKNWGYQIQRKQFRVV